MKLRYLLLVTFLYNCQSTKEEQSSLIESLESPAGDHSSLPHLVLGKDNVLYLSWVQKGDSNQTTMMYSRMQDSSWDTPETIASGTNWFVNWADYPMLAVDKHGNMLAHYLAKSSAGTYSYDINVITKKADSTDWSLPLPPHTDNTPTEHGFVTILPNEDSTFTLAWLDGRHTSGGGHDGHGSNSAMTLRTAVMDMQGQLSKEAELDARVCDCCQTTGVLTAKGPLFIYRDRSVDEVRDMAYVSKLDSVWSIPKLVAEDNWNIEGCPVNGPRAATLGETVATAWYTAALNRPKVKVAFKVEADFEEPILVDDTSPIGRVDIVMKNAETAIVSWLDGGANPAIKYREVKRNGSMSAVYVLQHTSDERGSGFPQMEIWNNVLYFAWTEMGEVDHIRLKKVPLD